MFQKISKMLLIMIVGALMLWASVPAHAKVSKTEADRLKKDLTPMGSERAGNAEGTIPEWTGGLATPPEGIGFKPGSGVYPNPYADDKVLFTITAQNIEKYADKLSPGIKQLFKKYPNTFKVNVYPTRRPMAMPEFEYERTYQNALSAELIGDGADGFENALGGLPFPIPQNGAEAIYNHLFRWQGYGFVEVFGTYLVHSNGAKTNGGAAYYNWMINYTAAKSPEEFEQLGGYALSNMFIYFEPARRKGEIILAKDPLDFRGGARAAWQYMPGQRRVRRAPSIAYDTPNPTYGGYATYDDAYMLNGQIDRFDWKLIGKKEMYVPYNTNAIDAAELEELLTPNHPNPEVVRWELHRVWEVEATLKSGSRHCYGKRTYFLDEDSWTVTLRDNYDTRGTLWRTAFAGNEMRYDIPYLKQRCLFMFDFQVDSYIANQLTQGMPERGREKTQNPEDFTPQNVRKMGKR